MQSLLQRHYTKGLQHFYGKGPQPLLRASSQNAHEKITISGILTHLYDCVIFTVYTQLTNVTVGCKLETNVLHYKYKYNTLPQVKVKFTLEQSLKAQRGSGGIALLFL
jgi:hypothetical protein